MTHNQHTTTTVQVQMHGRTILDCIMQKLPSSRKYYRVTLIVPDNGIPIIEYQHTSSSKRPKKSIQFTDLLFADKKHDTSEKFAFSLYTIDKTVTFLAQDETSMNEWLSKIRERHSELYPEMRYEAIFEVNLLYKDLAKAINVRGPHRLALCKNSLDLIPVLTASQLLLRQDPAQHNRRQHKLWKCVTIELAIRTIRRCGHTDSTFYLESGRQSRIGPGGLWMSLNKKSAARQLHELLLATMKLTSTTEDQFICKPPRSRSGSSSENAHRSQQSRSSSLICLAADPACTATSNATITSSNNSNININVNSGNINNNSINNIINNSMEDDNGYLHMA